MIDPHEIVRCRASVSALLVALLAAGAAGCGREREQPAPARRDESAVALFLANDRGGSGALFQLSSVSGDVTSVAAADGGEVVKAAVARGGECAVVTLKTGDEAPLVQRRLRFDSGTAEEVAGLAPLAGRDVEAVSRGCRAVAVSDERRALTVASPEGVRTIDASSLGRITYGVALSPDGRRLAFSTMEERCAGVAETQAHCPVRLYAVDLAAGEPRLLAGGEAGVAYDPEFSDDGASLTYMTSEGDQSPACRGHVNACRYAVKRIAFEGGAPELLFDDAVHGRRAPDGTFSFRRLGPVVVSGQRSWSQQSLFIVREGQPVPRRDKLGHWLHRFSPDSAKILVATWDREPGLSILARDGTAEGPTLAGVNAKPVGWALRPQPPGKRLLAGPPALRLPR